MTSPSDDLITSEGVDEGSTESTAEEATSTEGRTGVQPRSSSPAGESDPAPPVDTETGASRSARAERGTGQQLSAGEG